MATLATVTFPHVNGLEKDEITHSYAISSMNEDTDPGDIDLVATALTNVYNDSKPASVPGDLAEVMAVTRSRAALACSIRFYDVTSAINGGPHGSPYALRQWTLDAPAGGSVSLPDEVAIVATLEAAGRGSAPVETADGVDPGSLVDRPKQRYTGRVYMGPWTTNAIKNVTPYDRPSEITCERIRLAMEDLAAEIEAVSIGFRLCVWSRVDGTMRTVEACSTDDAWDTQRRRGTTPTTRTRLEF